MYGSLKRKTLKAAIWLFIRKFFSKIINLVAIAILARKLSPADFGVVALARVVLNFITGGISQGTATYIIYDNSKDARKKINTAFYLNLIFILLVVIIVFLLTPFIVNFYKGSKDLSTIIKMFTLMFVFSELRAIPDATMKKKLEYNKIVIRDSVLDILSALLSVYMAIKGYGVWSLVIPFLLSSFVSLPVSFIQSGYIPGHPTIYKAKSIATYTLNIIGANTLTLIGNQGDKLITGKMLGFYELGLYNRAFASANLAVQNIKSVITEVSFPSFSLINKDEQRLRSNFLKMLKYLSIVGFPISIFLIILAKEFILTLYGPQWKGSIIPLQIISVMALRRIVGSPASTIFNAKGKPYVMLRFGMFFIPIYIASVFVGAKTGIIGISIAVTILKTLGGLVIFYLLANELNIRFWNILSPMIPALKMSLLSGLLVVFFKWLVYIKSPVIALFVWSITGGLIYILLILTQKELREDIMELIRSK